MWVKIILLTNLWKVCIGFAARPNSMIIDSSIVRADEENFWPKCASWLQREIQFPPRTGAEPRCPHYGQFARDSEERSESLCCCSCAGLICVWSNHGLCWACLERGPLTWAGAVPPHLASSLGPWLPEGRVFKLFITVRHSFGKSMFR